MYRYVANDTPREITYGFMYLLVAALTYRCIVVMWLNVSLSSRVNLLMCCYVENVSVSCDYNLLMSCYVPNVSVSCDCNLLMCFSLYFQMDQIFLSSDFASLYNKTLISSLK